MGTKLPWDPEWTIESLSDSTIYMAYYTISKHIRKNGIKPAQLTDEVFDYVFLGLGKPAKIAAKARIDIKVLEDMRRDFQYFYPLDSRHSGRDLVPNHLTFLIFNHTAIFPQELWPRQIVTNGSVTMQGAKMSKSFGNIIPLIEGIAQFGADPLRMGILATAELLQDADFSPTLAKSMQDRLERLCRFGEEMAKNGNPKEPRTLALPDRWMLSRLQEHIRMATEAMDRLAVRKAIHSGLYELDQDVQWYLRRTADQMGTPLRKEAVNYVLSQVIDAQVKMLAPVTPHVCEELWAKRGGEGFVALASWPKPDSDKLDVKAEESETLIESAIDDTQNIIKATNMTPKTIYYYVAATWKWKAHLAALRKSVSAKVVQGELMKELMTDPLMKKEAKSVVKFVGQITEEVNRMSPEKRQRQLEASEVDETAILKDAGKFLGRELNAEIHIYSEDDPKRHDPKNRAQMAKPYRPAIYVE
jgi:leucyl-tRNA synthetase